MPMRFDDESLSNDFRDFFSPRIEKFDEKTLRANFQFQLFFLNEALDHLLLPLKKWIQPLTTTIT